MAFKDALIAASPVLLGMGQQLSGRNPAGIASGLAMMNAEQEKAKRKAAIDGLIGSMGLSQQKADFLSTLPFEQQAPMIWEMMNPQAVEGKVMGDRLVDPYTGKVISDFSPKPLDLSGIFGSEQGQEIKAGLMARGLPEHVADAFLVNMNDESGLNPGINERNPVVPGSRGGFGLAQWTGPRRKQLEAYAAQRGTSPDDMNTQLDFLVTELQGSESQAGQKILNAPDRATAAQAIVNDFLRPAEQHRDARSARYASLDKQITDITRILSSGQGTEAQRKSLEFRRERLMDEQSTLAPQAPKTTDDITEFEYARQNGYQGSFEEWQMSRSRAIGGIDDRGQVNVGEAYNPADVVSTIGLLDEIYQDPKVGRVTGPLQGGGGNDIDNLNMTQRMMLGPEGLALVEKIGQVQSRGWLAARDMLKGGGPITDYESRKAEGAVARLSRAKSEPEFRAAVKEFREAVADGVRKLQAAGKAPANIQIPNPPWTEMTGNIAGTPDQPSAGFDAFAKSVASDPDVQRALQGGLTLEQIWRYHPDNPESK